MKLLVVYQLTDRGWGQRIFRYINENLPDSWEMDSMKINTAFPPVIDEPEDFLPEVIEETEILLVLTESTGLAQLIPDIAERSKAEAVIAPIDSKVWFPEGLKNQVEQKLTDSNIDSAFPQPFCSLTEGISGNNLIKEFASHFGRPEAEISWKDQEVQDVNVKRSAPCGSTGYIATNLIGIKRERAGEKGGLYHQLFPCLASVDLIHKSAYISEAMIKRALKMESKEGKK